MFLLMCTCVRYVPHSKRICVRLCGPVLAEQLQKLAGNDRNVQIRRCSHIGGHKYAGNVVVLPEGTQPQCTQPRVHTHTVHTQIHTNTQRHHIAHSLLRPLVRLRHAYESTRSVRGGAAGRGGGGAAEGQDASVTDQGGAGWKLPTPLRAVSVRA